MRLIDADALKEKQINVCYEDDYESDGFGVVYVRHVDEAPTIDAMDCNVLRRIINSETARLYRADEKMIKAMGGYNPSSFLVGYKYAIDCIASKFSMLQRERKTDG